MEWIRSLGNRLFSQINSLLSAEGDTSWSQIQEAAEREYRSFRNHCHCMDRRSLYKSAEKIVFYERMKEQIRNTKTFCLDQIEELDDEAPIETLWQMYLSCDDLDICDESITESLLYMYGTQEEGGKENLCQFADYTKKAIDL